MQSRQHSSAGPKKRRCSKWLRYPANRRKTPSPRSNSFAPGMLARLLSQLPNTSCHGGRSRVGEKQRSQGSTGARHGKVMERGQAEDTCMNEGRESGRVLPCARATTRSSRVRQVPGRPVAPRRAGGGGLGAELSRPAIFAERAGQRRCAQQLLLNRSAHSGIVICVQAPWASRWMRDTPHAHSRAFCLNRTVSYPVSALFPQNVRYCKHHHRSVPVLTCFLRGFITSPVGLKLMPT